MARVVKEAEVRREELLHTALGLFLENGYERTTVEQITGAVGVAKGTFYHYFRTKADLLAQLVDAFTDEVFAQVEAELGKFGGSAVESLRAFLASSSRVKFGRMDEAMLVSRALYSEDNGALRERMVGGWIERTRPLLVAIVEQGVTEGAFDVEDPEATTAIWLSLWYDYGGRLAPAMLDAVDHPENNARIAQIAGALRALETAQERILGVPEGSLKLGLTETAKNWVQDS